MVKSEESVIRAEGLGKRYRLGTREPYKTLRETLVRTLRSSLGRTPGSAGERDEELWALRNVSFEVREGEVLGVIGRNGAGKTTLLKVLSRVTGPSEGEVRLRGRVGSLLEVGTGFHPELTGRENIFLNGGILGMRRSQVRRVFDEIVAFAGTGRFLDTPVKRYSSGMYMRLAFAVAAHLEPEILVVDEVLSVGDAAFQRKCLGKMDDVSKKGRTVLFVSHNLQAIRSLCPRSILLDEGKVIFDGPTEKTLNAYSSLVRDLRIDETTSVNNPALRRGEGSVRITSVALEDREGNQRFDFTMGESVRLRLGYRVYRPMTGLSVYIGVRAGRQRDIVTSVRHIMTTEAVPPGTKGEVTVEIPDLPLRPGEYPLYLLVQESQYTRTNFDLLDDLTAPLVVTDAVDPEESGFDTGYTVGYFSVPSRIVSSRIVQGQ